MLFTKNNIFPSVPGYSLKKMLSFDNRRNITSVPVFSGDLNRETFDSWSESSAFLFFCLRELYNMNMVGQCHPDQLPKPFNLYHTTEEVRDIIDSTFDRWDFEKDDGLADEDARRNDLLPDAYKLSADHYNEPYHYGFPFGPENRFLSDIGGRKELMASVRTALIFTIVNSVENSQRLNRSDGIRDDHLIQDIGFNMDSILFRMEFGLSACEAIGLKIYQELPGEGIDSLTLIKNKYRLGIRGKDWAGYKSPPRTTYSRTR